MPRDASPPDSLSWLPPRPELPGPFSRFLIRTPARPIGIGGFGAVWLASSSETPGVPLAIKFFNPSSVDHIATSEARFALEAHHQNIVKTLAVLDLRRSPGWWPFALVMKYYPASLSAVLSDLRGRNEALPSEIGVRFLRHLAEALLYLHGDRKVVHRDVKPSNILVELASDEPYTAGAASLVGAKAVLGDLGTAVRIGGRVPFYLSDDGYKAPEVFDPVRRAQFAAQPAQDLYSFGKIAEVMAKVLDKPVPWLNELSIRCRADDPRSRPTAEQAWAQVLFRSEIERPTAELGAIIRSLVSDVHERAKAVDALRRDYTSWIAKRHGILELRGVRELSGSPTIPLDTVYVALKGDRATSYERQQSRALLDAELQVLKSDTHARTPQETEGLRHQLLAQNPLIASLVERDRPGAAPFQARVEVVNLAEAFARDRRLIILGDPGSGKTTLVRWLALQLANASIRNQERVRVPASHVDPTASATAPEVDLGPTRLPVLLRVADFAAELSKARSNVGQPQLELIDYFGRHSWLDEGPHVNGRTLPPEGLNDLIRQHLKVGTAVILLDGMDEIPDPTIREEVIRAIERFVRNWVDDPQRSGGLPLGTPAEVGGNQVVITSRIAGYHVAPIRGEFTHVTVERMQQPAIERFCEQWVLAVARAKRPDCLPAEVEAEAQQDAAKLKAAIFEPGQRGVAELATNPLLVTILALLFFQKGGQQLPKHRAELYQRAMEVLITEWRVAEFTSDQLAMILGPVACYIHETYSTGLIPEGEFRMHLEHSIRQVALQTRALFQTRGQGTAVDYIIDAVVNRVGLVAERGEGLFGFLHLTFQEYLAGLSLLRGPDEETVASQLLERFPDPRWHEPVLLALGRVGSHFPIPGGPDWGRDGRKRLLLRLLNSTDASSELLPRVVLLMARGLEEMEDVPEQVVESLTRQLVLAYADRDRYGRFPEVRDRIEKAFARLYSNQHAEAAERAVVELLGDPSTAAAAASLLKGLGHFTHELGVALLDALPHDRADWGWPIQACLQAIVTPATQMERPRPPQLPTAELEQLRQTDLTAYHERRANFDAAVTAYSDRLARYLIRVNSPPIVLPANRLRFRQALESQPQLVRRITSDSAVERLVVALYGGYDDFGAADVYRDYREIARFLQQSDDIRKQEIARDREYYVGRFGFDDPVYNAAVYLDTGMSGLLTRARTAPEFRPGAIFRDSPLTDTILAVLQREDEYDPSSLILTEKLWWIWQTGTVESGNPGDADPRVDAAVGLVALGQDIIPVLDNCQQPDLVRTVLDRLSQLRKSLTDPVTRALRQPASVELSETDRSGKPRKVSTTRLIVWLMNWVRKQVAAYEQKRIPNPLPHWESLFTAFAGVEVAYTDEPFRPELLTYLPRPYNARPLAEYWAERFVAGVGDDLLYHFAVGLDRMTNSDPIDVVASLGQLHWSVNRVWPGCAVPWVIEPIPPRFEEGELPTEVIDAIENVRTEYYRPEFRQVIRSVFLDSISHSFDRHPDWVPELLIVNTQNWHSRTSVLAAAHRLPEQDDAGHILEMAKRLDKNPVMKARTLCRFIRYFPNQRSRVVAEAMQAVGAIDHAAKRCRAWESLYPHLARGPESADVLFRIVGEALPEIADPDERARALARVAGLGPRDQRRDYFERALEAANEIPNVSKRAATLSLLLPLLPPNPTLQARGREVAHGIGDPIERATALGLRGPHLLEAEAWARKHTPADVKLWLPVVLGGLVLDVISRFSVADPTDALWLELGTRAQARTDRDATIASRLKRMGAAKGLTLTRVAAEAVERCWRRGLIPEIRDLLPLLQDVATDATPVVEEWLRNQSEPELSNYAALYLAEPARRITPETIDGLLTLMTSDEDRTRLRACLVLQGRIVVLERERRYLLASDLGASVLGKLAYKLLEHRQKGPFWGGWVVGQTLRDTLFDDPRLIAAWCHSIRLGDDQAETSRVLIEHMSDLSQPAWDMLGREYRAGDDRVRRAILRGVFRALQDQNKPRHFEPGDLNWLNPFPGADDASGIRILRKLPCPVLEAIRLSRELLPSGTTEELAALAAEKLASIAETANDILNRPDRLAAISAAANDLTWVHDWEYPGNLYNRKQVDLWGLVVNEPPESLDILCRWLVNALKRAVDDDDTYYERTWLLFAVGLFAERAPDSFAKLAMELQLEEPLARVVNGHRWEPARIGAVRLLGKMKRITVATAITLQRALFDEGSVRELVQDVLAHLPSLEAPLLDQLFIGLTMPSALLASSSAQILAAFVRNERTAPVLRTDILNHLVNAIKNDQTDRGVYDLAGSGTGEDDHRRIAYRGQLRQLLFRALVDVSGGL